MDELISRKQAINALDEWGWDNRDDRNAVDVVSGLPPIQPEIVRCEECLYRKICSWEKQGAKFCSFAEKREVTT